VSSDIVAHPDSSAGDCLKKSTTNPLREYLLLRSVTKKKGNDVREQKKGLVNKGLEMK
jgi:hypothetical protein